MYEVFLWVPTKGWKILLRTKSERKAIAKALEFVPLEVKMTDGSGNLWVSGRCHQGMEGEAGLTQIEQLNESLCVPV